MAVGTDINGAGKVLAAFYRQGTRRYVDRLDIDLVHLVKLS